MLTADPASRPDRVERPGGLSCGRWSPEAERGLVMEILSAEQLTRKACAPCEGGVPPLAPEEAQAFLQSVPGWTITPEGQRIRREWTAKNFKAAIDFFNRVAA